MMWPFKRKPKFDLRLHFEPKEDLKAYELMFILGVMWGSKTLVASHSEWEDVKIKCPGIERHFRVEPYV